MEYILYIWFRESEIKRDYDDGYDNDTMRQRRWVHLDNEIYV